MFSIIIYTALNIQKFLILITIYIGTLPYIPITDDN